MRPLVALLTDEEDPVAERAAALLMLFPAESCGSLARALRTAVTPEARRRAAQALGACRQDAAVAALVDALEDPTPSVRAGGGEFAGRQAPPGYGGGPPGGRR